jgi:glycosyltransferase involved in cell wall biosynthesis
VLEAADMLRERTDVHFLFVGAGAAREALVEKARALRLENVSFHPSVPKADMPRVWSLCDLGLVHLKDRELFGSVIPSKIFECFGMGVPVVFAGPDGEAAEIVRAERAGIVLPAEDPKALAEAVAELEPDRLAEMRAASRAAAPRYDRARNALDMLAALERVAAAAERRRTRVSGAARTQRARIT